jgi:hypothetical protein
LGRPLFRPEASPSLFTPPGPLGLPVALSGEDPETKTRRGDSSENGQRPFDRFEKLTRKLVRVPKREVQEAEAKREKRKSR